MVIIMSAKEPSLHTRLNDLENELKELHDRILNKRRNFKIQKNLVNHSKIISKQSVQKKRSQILSEKNEKTHNELRWNIPCDLDNNFKKEKDVIGKTASLTEITSLSSGLNKVLRSINNNEVYNLYGVQLDNQMLPKKKSKLVQNQKQSYKSVNKTLSDVLEYKKKETTSNYESLEEMDYRTPEFKILKEQIQNIKKKLRDERTKREIAERAIVGYRRRLAVLEGKTEKEKLQGVTGVKGKNAPLVDFVASLQKQLQEEYSVNKKSDKDADMNTRKTLASLEKQLIEERTKRLEAEKLVTELKISLEESKKTVIKLEEGRKLAVAMADQFREKATDHDSQELKKLKAEKVALEMELQHSNGGGEVTTDLVKKLIDRAERAENELIEKMKQCNNFMAKSSLNDPDVVKLIEKHKKAYAELQLEKKSKEIELKNRCQGFLKEIEAATEAADIRFKEINNKYNQAVRDLKKKESAIDKIKDDKNNMEIELKNLKNKLQEISKRKDQQEELIVSLKDAAKCNDEKIEKSMKETEDAKELYISLEIKYNKLHGTIVEQDKILEKLRLELEEEKDTVKIKDKMLQDQVDTIKCLRIVADNTKRSLDEERILKQQLLDDIYKLETSREKIHSKLVNSELKLKGLEDRTIYLKQLEAKAQERHMESQQQIAHVSLEKDKAIQNARFVTETLVKTVNDYENKLNNHEKIQEMLNSALKEKDYQLHVAKQQVQELNEEVWRSAQMTEKMRNDLQTKLKKACEVCTDIIDTQVLLD